MLTARQIDARIRQLAAKDVPDAEICVRLLVPYQRVAQVLVALRQPAPQEYAAPEPAPAPEQPPATPAPAEEAPPIADPITHSVLELLEKVAASSAPCLSNTTMADIVGRNHGRVNLALGTLEQDGLIRIERKGPQRRIIIVATGRATGWSPHPRSRGGGAAIMPAGFGEAVIDQARRLLMSRDYQVLSAGPGLYRVDGRIRTADELVAMANRQLVTMNRPPLVGAAA